MKEQLSRKAEEVSRILKQLAHPARLRVLCCLLEGEKTVTELIEYADVSQSLVSQFLLRMKLEGLVDARKEGSFVYYRIADPKLRALIDGIYRIYCTSKKS